MTSNLLPARERGFRGGQYAAGAAHERTEIRRYPSVHAAQPGVHRPPGHIETGDGASLYYKTWGGPGQAVLSLHAWALPQDMWASQMLALSSSAFLHAGLPRPSLVRAPKSTQARRTVCSRRTPSG